MLSLDQALAELPDTADGIAAYLIEQECRGRRRNARCCPVANYLTGTGEFFDADVDPALIDALIEGDQEARVETPAHIAEFIKRFDDGEWPELVDEPEVADV